MLTRGCAFSLSRIRVSADAMEMEMAMTADGTAPPSPARLDGGRAMAETDACGAAVADGVAVV